MSLHQSAYNICQEAIAILREEQDMSEEAVLTGVKHVTIDGVSVERQANKAERACHRSYERVRHQVIDSFNWSFLRRECNCVTSGTNERGEYVTPYPAFADIKILGCYDDDGHRVQWRVVHRESIVSDRPIAKIAYLEDDDDANDYPHLVRNAIVYSLASAIAIELTGRASDAQMCATQAANLIQQARTDDARQSGTGTSAYGRNYLFDVATGRVRPKHIGGSR